MRYLFDTNTCIALINDTSPSLLTRLRRHRPEEIGVPSPVAFELYFGAFKSRGPNLNLAVIDRMAFEIVPFDAADARAAGAIRRDLEARQLPLGRVEVLIAGQARARGLVLVTTNTREFERVDGLKLKDWSIPVSAG